MTTPLQTLATQLLATAGSDAVDADDNPVDHLSLYAAVRPFLTIQQERDLADMLEICPIHVIDAAICADDDDPECRGLRH